MINLSQQSKENGYPQSIYLQPDQEGLDVRRYIGLFLSNWYWFLLSLFIAGTLAYCINTYSERLFVVSSTMLIKDDKGGSGSSSVENVMPGGDIFRSQQNLQNEIGRLRSLMLNLKVMNELPDFHVTYFEYGRRKFAAWRHYNDAPFIIDYDSLYKQNLGNKVFIRITPDLGCKINVENSKQPAATIKFGETFKQQGFDFRIRLRNSNYKYDASKSNNYAIVFEDPEILASVYKNKLSIAPIQKDATLVSLSVSGPLPVQESIYLNKLMEVYIQQGQDDKKVSADSTINFINNQLKTILDSLNRAEDSLTAFRLKKKFFNLPAEGTAVMSKIQSFENERIQILLQLKYYQYLTDYLNSRNDSSEIISPTIMGVDNPILISIVTGLSALNQQKKQLQFNFSKDIPAGMMIDKKIEDARKSLAENLRTTEEIIKSRLEDVNKRISNADSDLLKLPVTEREYVNLDRNFTLNNTVYTYMLEKRSEASIARASNVPSNKIIDYATGYGSQIKPKTRRNYMIAFLLGILIPGVYIFFTDQLQNKIIDKKDIEKETSVPIIGFVGHNLYSSELPVTNKPGSSLSESFRSIRTNLKYYLKDKNKGVILVTSTLSGEGKTFISTNLALVLSMLGRKTLLIGLDLRKPRIHKIFNLTEETGLSTYLIGETDFNDVISSTPYSNLYYAHSGPIPPNPSELMESARMKEFIEQAKSEFDYIVLDTPPIGIVSDALLIGQFTDLNLFVVRQRFTFKNTLELIQGLYDRKELENLTIAVNDINVSGYYGYGLRYGYGFYAGYGYNYGNGTYGTYRYGDYHKYYIED